MSNAQFFLTKAPKYGNIVLVKKKIHRSKTKFWSKTSQIQANLSHLTGSDCALTY